MTLYYTTRDGPNFSNLSEDALAGSPVFYVPDIIVPPLLNASDFGTYIRDHLVKQTTYKGYPLYYFYQDKAPGDTLGHKASNVWFVINPTQFPP